ncbi:hypothetical protein QAD02_002372 [Eretmocerus hayati]|uniref:Uncharacterized protein n=1 Tax=Eretmocerus hayati TaxID=131215 RepID=A0ACC2NJN4_9HYME|nr:hypothetical protein QAD02_002372 [Eretmocerus hayati]
MNLSIVDSRSGTDLRKIPVDELWKSPNIGDETLICTTCWRDLGKYEPDSEQESTPQSDKPDSQGSTSQKFNVTQSIDCMLGGKEDVKLVVQEDGSRKLEQKKLILCDITELCEKFREEHPEDKVSISKFFTLRPKQCVVTGSSGTHGVCVFALLMRI